MLDEGNQFYVEPQQQHVRQVQELQLPTAIYEKPISSQDTKPIALKMVQIPRQTAYQYKRFKFDKRPESEQQEEDEQTVGQTDSPFTEFYSQEQLVYKKYHNENIARFKNSYYFSGTFVHNNVFTSKEPTSNNFNRADSVDFQDLIKEFYDISEADLPQDSLQQGDLKFDSMFQSGNLFAAFKISNSQYDLVMQIDKNSRGNNQWFYFSVENMISGKQYTFNVVNFTKNDSLFNYGMEPAVYSLIQGQKIKDPEKVWKKMGIQVSYKKGMLPRQNSRRHYYKLSFKVFSKYSGDKLFIAHSYPYTLSKLNDYLHQKCQKNKDIVQRLTIGKTLSKRPIQVLKITANVSKKKDTRKAVIIMARQHPGQTQGSFVCEGVIQKLVSKSKQGDFLRKNYVFYVIPMVNVDGVIYGHYRTNLSGKDLNRKWDSTQKQTVCPEVTSIKAFIAELGKQRQIRFILDLHGHSKKLNSFFYGNPCAQNPQVVRIYPYICSKISQAIQFYDCTFSSDEYKRKAARVYLSFLYKLMHVYTFQVSFYAYFKDGKKIQFTPKQFRDLGGSLITGLAMQLEHQIKYQQSFDFSIGKNFANKQYMNSPFIKLLTQLKQNKSLLQIGNQDASGSQSKPQQGQVDQKQITEIKRAIKVIPPLSCMAVDSQPKSIKISRKGPRQVKQQSRPVRNIRFLQISKINSILPDKYQLCLQPIRNQPPINQTLKTSNSIMMKQNCQCQTQKDIQETKYKEIKRLQIEGMQNLSNSVRVQPRNLISSNQKRYSSVIRTQNRNNIIFKIDFMTQETRKEKIGHLQKIARNINLKHAFSQTIISFNSERQKQKEKIRDEFFKDDRIKSSQIVFPSVDQKRITRNKIVKYDTVRIANKRQAEIFLNGVVKKYLVQKQQPRQEPLTIFTKALERPKSFRQK